GWAALTWRAGRIWPGRLQGRWGGKPGGTRRGPATVTGDADRRRAARTPLARHIGRPGRRGTVGPGARRPPPTDRPIRPRGKGWLHEEAPPGSRRARRLYLVSPGDDRVGARQRGRPDVAAAHDRDDAGDRAAEGRPRLRGDDRGRRPRRRGR